MTKTRKKKLFKIPVGRKNLDGKFGMTDSFINVLAVNRSAAKQQIRKKHLKKGQSILR